MDELQRRFGPVTLTVHGSPELLGAVERAFVLVPATDESHAHLRLTATQLPEPAADPCQSDGASPLFFHDRTRVRHHDGTLWVWDGASVARIVPGSTSVELHWHPDSLATDEFSRTFLYVLVSLMLRSHGVFYIHGALVGTGETTLLLLGESGAGKSTTVLTCITGGWDWWTDDAVLLWEQPDGTPTLGGIARPFHLTEQTIDAFAELRESVVGVAAGTGKAITCVHRTWTPRSEPVQNSRAVLLRSERADTTSSEAMPQASIFAAVGRACAWFGIGELYGAEAQTRVVMRLALTTSGIAVALGPDSLRDLPVLANALIPSGS